MPDKRIFEGQAIKSELVVMILEKHGLHPTQHDAPGVTDLDDIERETFVTVPEDEHERAHQVLFGESDKDRHEF
jgi:hypothetical protein